MKKTRIVIAFIAVLFSLALITCGDKDSGNPSAPAHTHIWGVWVENPSPTCTAKGVETRICTLDSSHTEIRNIDSLGHAWGNWTLSPSPATCTATGNTGTGSCTRCPQMIVNSIIPALGHDFSWAESTVWGIQNKTCSRCTETGKRLAPDIMANIPAGNIAMSGTFTVNLSAFKIGKYQVTQAQYQEVMGNNPSYFVIDVTTGEIQEKRPVEQVTWYDAVEFCNKLSEMEGLTSVYTITGRTPATGYPITSATVTADFSKNGYRLPTESQWEYACRAGLATGTYSKNIDGVEVTTANLGDHAWYSTNSDSKTHEVGKKKANYFGLYDMHGNVWEWCWDWYAAYPSGTQTDFAGAVTGSYRVFRGGSWDNSAAFAGSSFRIYGDPVIRYNNLGFRLACP